MGGQIYWLYIQRLKRYRLRYPYFKAYSVDAKFLSTSSKYHESEFELFRVQTYMLHINISAYVSVHYTKTRLMHVIFYRYHVNSLM